MNLNNVPANLVPVVTGFSEQARELLEMLENGRISLQDWLERMRELIWISHTNAMALGVGVEDLTPLMRNTVIDAVDFQYDFLDNFANDIRIAVDAGEFFFDRWAARQDMYGMATQTTQQEGAIIGKLGFALPLPAMRGQGTQCHTNCGCEWRIVVIDKDGGDFNAYWIRAKDDSCQTCLIREEDWNPVYIRGGILMSEGYSDSLGGSEEFTVKDS